jgi:diguanylate cyclase
VRADGEPGIDWWRWAGLFLAVVSAANLIVAVGVLIDVRPGGSVHWWVLELAVVLGVGLVAGVVSARSRRHAATVRIALEHLVTELRSIADTDPLTGVHNRRSLVDRLAAIDRAGGSCSIAVLDLDHFKRLNDQHGHLVGDSVVRLVAETLVDTLRTDDGVIRYGGEEFLVLMPGVDASGAVSALRRVQRQLEGNLVAAHLPSVTLSAGVADREGDVAASEMLQRADDALYGAKHDGRNRIQIATCRTIRPDASDRPH